MNERTGLLLLTMKFQALAFAHAMNRVEHALLALETGGSLDDVIDEMNTMALAESAFDDAFSELQGFIEVTYNSNADPTDLTRNKD